MRTFRAILLATTTIVSPTLAAADPVTAVALATTIGTAVATATISSAVIGALVATAIGVAGAFARSLLAPKTSKNQAEIRTGETDPHPAWRRAYGEFKQQGALVFKHIEHEFLYAVWLLSDSKCHSIQKLWLNDIEMELTGDITLFTSDPGAGAWTNTPPFWDDEVAQFWFADGTQTGWPADFTFREKIPEVFKSTDTWAGSSMLFGRFIFGDDERAAKRWPTGAPPRVEVLMRGARVYDPRRDSTSGVQTEAQGDHRPDDDTTWQYIADDGTEIGANSALCTIDAMRWERALSIADERIIIQQVADAADDCEDQIGGVSTVLLHTQGWTGSAPTAQTVGTAAGSGNWTYNRGSVALATGTHGSVSGKPVCRLFSTDTDGTLADNELGRMGVYIDLEENGRSADVEYLSEITGAFAGGASAKRRIKFYTADAGGSASNADMEASFMPPDAANITLVYDSGVALVSVNVDGTHLMQGRYFSVVFEGGEPNEGDTEFGAITWNTTSQAALSRYRCDGLLKIETDEWSLLDPILDSMAGHLDTTAGKIGIRAGTWVAPTDTLSAPIGDGFEYVGRSDPGFAKVVPSFISRLRQWEETDGDEYVLRSGDRAHNLSLAFVREPEQAARLAKIFGERAKLNRTLTLTVSGREWGRRVGDRVTVSMSEFGRADGIYRIVGWEPITEPTENGAMRLYIRLTLQEDAEATYAWAIGDFTEPDAANPDPLVPTENVVPAISAEQSDYLSSGGTATPRLKVTVTPTSRQVSNGGSITIQTKAGSNPYTTLGTFATDTTVIAYLEPVTVGVTYIARARHSSGSLGQSDWAVSDPVTIVAADVSALLLESGDSLLLEDGFLLLLE